MCRKGKKIKLCFVIASVYPLFCSSTGSFAGGAEVNLYNLALKLAESGRYEITFLAGDYGQGSLEEYKGIRIKKIRFMDCSAGNRKYRNPIYKLLSKAFLTWELLRSNHDIYVNSVAGSIIGIIGFIAGKLKGKGTIYRLASDIEADPQKIRVEEGLITYLIYKYGLKRAGMLVCQTESQRDSLLKNVNLQSKVIRNGFFIVSSDNPEIRRYILWVSRAAEMKRPHLFIELARHIPSESFILIMPGENSVKSAVKDSISDLTNIKLIDHVPFFDIDGCFRQAKLLVNTSEYEGFPNTFIQACIAATPILSFSVNPDNFIERYELGCFCNDDFDKAVGFISGLDEQKIVYYGENGRKYVKAYHDINNSTGQYEEIIKGLMV